MSRDTIKLSICIPTYNRKDLLERCLKSILQQNAKGIEILVSDDSNNNDTELLMQRYLSEESNIQYFHSINDPSIPKESKQAANFNKLIERSRGEYIYILHDDDYLLPDGLDGIFNEIEAEQEQRKFIVFGVNIVDINKKVKRREGFSGQYYDPYEGTKLLLYEPSLIRTPGVVVHKSVYDRVGLYDLNRKIPLDFDMWTRIVPEFGLYTSDKTIAGYTIHQDTQTMQMFNSNNIDILLDIFKKADQKGVLEREVFNQCKSRFFYKWILAGIYRNLKLRSVKSAKDVLGLFSIKEIKQLKPTISWQMMALFFKITLYPVRGN